MTFSQFFLALFFLLASCEIALASTQLTVGTSVIHTDINDPRYQYTKEYEAAQKPLKFASSLQFGFMSSYERFTVGFRTNRLLNFPTRRQVLDTKTGLHFDNSTKITNDTFLLGYSYGRFIPQILIGNIKADKKLYFQNELIAKSHESTFIYGFLASYLLTKNFSTSVGIIAPNKALNLEWSAGLSFTYNFRL